MNFWRGLSRGWTHKNTIFQLQPCLHQRGHRLQHSSLGTITGHLTAYDNRATIDDDGASFRHVAKDREDLGDVVDPGDGLHPLIHSYFIDDGTWRGSIELLGSLKDGGLAGFIRKRTTEDQHSILDARMKISGGRSERGCRWRKVAWKAERGKESQCNNTRGKNGCTLHGSPQGRTGVCQPQ